MQPYGGFEPQVGEIRALRSFRVAAGGVLYPLFSGDPWSDGVNTARCRLTVGNADISSAHAAPEPGCSCGFYAYGSVQAAGEQPHARHVLAVVSSWGRIIAGTRGVRAEFSRVEALWLSTAVPGHLKVSLARQYPSAAVYSDQDTMLSEHPPSLLDCYEVPPPPAQSWLAPVVGLAVLLSALPARWWRPVCDARLAWALLFGCVVGVGLILRRLGRGRTDDVAGPRRRVVVYAAALWTIAPLAGPAGIVLLRIPLLQLTALLFKRGLMLRRAARTFPAIIH